MRILESFSDETWDKFFDWLAEDEPMSIDLLSIIRAAACVQYAYGPPAPLPAGLEVIASVAGNDLITDKLSLKIPTQFGYVLKSGAEYVVALRGTSNIFEFCRDLEFLRVFSPGGAVDDGFAGVASSLTSGDTSLAQAIAALPDAVGHLTITGHSLGGALALLTCRDVAAMLPTCITFASPRVGDAAWAKEYDLVCPSTVRVENRIDIVPHLPPSLFGFAAVGTLVDLVSKFSSFDVLANHRLATYIELINEIPASVVE